MSETSKPTSMRQHFAAKREAVCFKCSYRDGHSWSSDFLVSQGYAPTGFCCRWCAFPDLYDDRPPPLTPVVIDADWPGYEC